MDLIHEYFTIIQISGFPGTNGPYVVKALRAAGHHVVALVRNPDKPEATELRSLGVDLILGDTKLAEKAL
jgi:uncharacterized protein YbjT (DUF2867 family)